MSLFPRIPFCIIAYRLMTSKDLEESSSSKIDDVKKSQKAARAHTPRIYVPYIYRYIRTRKNTRKRRIREREAEACNNCVLSNVKSGSAVQSRNRTYDNGLGLSFSHLVQVCRSTKGLLYYFSPL
jgi:hypothetical protein